jgi:hypothetical protein
MDMKDEEFDRAISAIRVVWTRLPPAGRSLQFATPDQMKALYDLTCIISGSPTDIARLAEDETRVILGVGAEREPVVGS